MRIVLISGSHRVGSESEKVARFMLSRLNAEESLKRKYSLECELISLANNPIPLWEEGFDPNDPRWSSGWGNISQKLKAADGFVVVSPEWGGMVPSGLKNLFLLCTRQELAHKPALLTAVSSGMGGAYTIAELRSSSYKNTRICYIPDHLIIRDVTKMLNGETPESDFDRNIRKRIEYSLHVLLEYTVALKSVRDSGVIDLKSYPFGM